jgi:hypothetical protein
VCGNLRNDIVIVYILDNTYVVFILSLYVFLSSELS